jgi:N-acetylneuraminate synthase
MTRTLKIGNRLVGQEHPPFIIAEMSGNHNQSLDRALSIVDAAAASGAHAIKLQTYTADTLTIDYDKDEFFISDPASLWKGSSLYQLYQQAYTPWEWHKPIMDRCRERNIICFSTPFDETSVAFLESLNVPAYKIASFENNHLPLIKQVAATRKPLLLSTGMASIAEIDEAVRTAREAGCSDIILLKCTSAYPSSPEESNLMTIPAMRQVLDIEVGLSDHTIGIGVSIAGIALGATVIEKHFTLSRKDGGVDSAFSIEPHEMRQLAEESLRAWQSLGNIKFGPTDTEKKSARYRRSIYVVEDIQRGESFTSKNLRVIRPGLGLPPKYYDVVLGKRAVRDIKRGTPLNWDFVG